MTGGAMGFDKLDSVEPRLLGWDGSLGESENEVRWDLRHVQQKQDGWCWVACIRGALSSFGVEVDDADLIKELIHGVVDSGTHGLEFERLPEMWRRKGFRRAKLEDAPLPERALRNSLEQEGPVQLELVSAVPDLPRHVVLVTGFSEVAGGWRYSVSDFLDVEGSGYLLTYEDLRERLPRGLWKRTISGLEFLDGSLSRFVRKPGRFFSGRDLRPSDPDSGAPPCPMFPGSSLDIERVPDVGNLRKELFIGISGLRQFYMRGTRRIQEFDRPLWHGETLRLARRPRSLPLDLMRCDEWSREEWSSVVYEEGRERYYSLSRQRGNGQWYANWVGRSLARSLASGLRAISRVDAEGDCVEVVLPERWQTVLFRLKKSDLYLVAGCRGFARPFGNLLAPEDITNRLNSKSPERLVAGLSPIEDRDWRDAKPGP